MTARIITLVAFALGFAWLANSPDALAHGVHGPLTPSQIETYTPPPNAGWWEITYDRVQRYLEATLKIARDDGGLGPLLSIVLLAFGYGILHAVGPGHGKLLLASYMTATNAPVGTGVVIAFAAAAIQALIAISIVLVVALGLQGLSESIPALQSYVNAVSLALLVALGLAIVARQLAVLGWLPEPIAQMTAIPTCACCGHGDHKGEHSHTHVGHHGHGASHHHHEGQEVMLERAQSQFLGAVGLAASMGMRPCTSAFAILLLALANGLLGLGVLATLAMAAGVAMTLAMVAVISVDAREHAGTALQRSWLPENAMGVLSLCAGVLLTSLALAGLVRAATL